MLEITPCISCDFALKKEKSKRDGMEEITPQKNAPHLQLHNLDLDQKNKPNKISEQSHVDKIFRIILSIIEWK